MILNKKQEHHRAMPSPKTAPEISRAFNGASLGGFVQWTASLAMAFFVGGVLDFTFFHNHPAGQAIIGYCNEFLLNIYDSLVRVFGVSELARNTDFLTPSGVYQPLDLLG